MSFQIDFQDKEMVKTTQSSFVWKKKDSVRRLSSFGGYTTLFISTRTPTTSNEGEGLFVKVFDRRVCHRHLLWHLLFRGITTLEWFILYLKLESQEKTFPNISDVCLFGVLSTSANTRKRLDCWDSRTRPIHRGLLEVKSNLDSFLDREYTLLDLVMHELKVPQKGESKDTLYHVQKLNTKRITLPGKKFRGIGYKDKGSMAPIDTNVPDPDYFFLLEEPVEIVDLSHAWKNLKTDFFSPSLRSSG